MNFPEAIPEEVFVHLKPETDKTKMSAREAIVTSYFLNHYHKVIENRAEKDVYLANGFTQRNQRLDQTEERLREEIASDFNEFESINREAENILGLESVKKKSQDDE